MTYVARWPLSEGSCPNKKELEDYHMTQVTTFVTQLGDILGHIILFEVDVYVIW